MKRLQKVSTPDNAVPPHGWTVDSKEPSKAMDLVLTRRLTDIYVLMNKIFEELGNVRRFALDILPPGLYEGKHAEDFEEAHTHIMVYGRLVLDALEDRSSVSPEQADEVARNLDQIKIGCGLMAHASAGLASKLPQGGSSSGSLLNAIGDHGSSLVFESARRLLILETEWLRRWARRQEIRTLTEENRATGHAERMRRYRAMKSRGFRDAAVKVHESDLDRLRRYGLLKPRGGSNSAKWPDSDELDIAMDMLVQIALASLEGNEQMRFDFTDPGNHTAFMSVFENDPFRVALAGRLRGMARLDQVSEKIEAMAEPELRAPKT